jgi:hypothetical protein
VDSLEQQGFAEEEIRRLFEAELFYPALVEKKR